MKTEDIVNMLGQLGCTDISTMTPGKVKSGCPFAPWRHGGGSDSHPSFVVWPDDEVSSSYYCAGCKASGGSMLSLVWRFQELSNRDMTKLIAFVGKADRGLDPAERVSRFEYKPSAGDGEWVPPKRKKKEMEPIPEACIEPFTKNVAHHFLQRGLTEETCRAWGLGDDPRRGRALFPVRDIDKRLLAVSGRLYRESCCGIKYKDFDKVCPKCGRKKQPKYLHSKGFRKGLVLYGEHMIDPEYKTGIIVEGNMDPIAIWQAGFRNPVAIMGSSPTLEQCERMVQFFDRLIVVPDGDEAGDEMGKKFEEMLGNKMPVIIRQPERLMDPASLGNDGIKTLLSGLFPY